MYKYVREDVYGGETRTNYWQDFGKGLIKVFWTKEASSGKNFLRCEMRAEKIKKLRANFIVMNLSAVREYRALLRTLACDGSMHQPQKM